MRLGLLSVISWMVTLTKPLISIGDFSFSGRDLIMLVGGIFLLFKATTELHERLENRQHDAGHGKGYASFWVVVLQIVVLDAVFSLDAVITAVGMVNHLPVMMAAVVIAMILMLLASKPLTRFVNQHPTVVVLCLSFLLMIGLSLVAEGFGFHIPKGYLYAAIGFSITIEFFNPVARRNFIRHQSTLPLRARTADAILRLMGGRKQATVAHDSDSPAAVPVPEGAFAEEERYMINGVLTLAQRSLRSIMTREAKLAGWMLSRVKKKFVASCFRLRTACSRFAAVNLMKSSVLYAPKRCWWRWRRARTLPRWHPLPRRLWCRKRWIRSICWACCAGRAAVLSSSPTNLASCRVW